MPLTRISLRRGKTPDHHRALFDGIYRALRDTFDVPEGDLFMTLDEHEPSQMVYGPDYMAIQRSDDLVLIQITVTDRRSVAQKQALFARVADNLAADPGLRPEDVFVNLVEVRAENWSFGLGLAQYAA